MTNPRYKNLTYTREHPFVYDTVWTIALALNRTNEILKSSRVSDGRMRRLEDFTYDDKEMANIMLDSLANVSFFGVSVNIKTNLFFFFRLLKICMCLFCVPK